MSTATTHAYTCLAEDVLPSFYLPDLYVVCQDCGRFVAVEKNKLPIRGISATGDYEEKTVEKPSPEPPPTVRTEALVCASCDRTWDRPIKRGRKPSRCPACS